MQWNSLCNRLVILKIIINIIINADSIKLNNGLMS